MRKIMSLLILFVFLAISSISYANPPYDIKITFDTNTKMLRAVIFHDVSNPRTHYIKEVDVALNGKKVIQHNIFQQDNNYSQTVSYLIPNVKNNDVLSVESYCSINGRLKKEITVK